MIDPQQWNSEPKKDIVPVDLHAPADIKGYSMKELMPDPEVVTSLQNLTRKILEEENVEMENWLRRVSIPLIDEGYRFGELELIISSNRYWRQDRPLRILLPRKDVNPLLLMIRRVWRRYFPYRLPDGQLFKKISREVVTVK